MVWTGPGKGHAPYEGVMSQLAKLTGHAALRAIAWTLTAAGIAGCVVPGESAFAVKPVPVAPPSFSEIAQPVATETPEQSIRPGQNGATDASRRELTFPETNDLPPPQGNTSRNSGEDREAAVRL
jgi:hypothetical protein